MNSPLDDALGVLSDTGPEYQAFGGAISLANHGPMVVDAMCALGHADAVVPWAEEYRPRLEGPPPRQARIAGSEWLDALGQKGRVRDWADLFDAELSEHSWTEVLDLWVPRLAPGMIGGLHGAIRTAHAVRGIGRGETAPRRRELAEGLAYWASGFETLPDAPSGPGTGMPSQVIGKLQQLDLSDRTGWLRFTDPIGKLTTQASFASVTGMVDLTQDPSAVVTDLARTFSLILLSNSPTVNPRALCHGLTAGTVYRLMQPHLSVDAAQAVLRYSWQVAAAFYCAIVLEPPSTNGEATDGRIEEIIGEAIACPDEHGIKVTEACLREYQLDPDPVFLTAALATTRRLNEVGLNLY